jgi:hypothetical protein
MKLEVKNMGDITLVGYWNYSRNNSYIEYVEIVKCYDTDFLGKQKVFYRVDHSGRTVSTLNRTKAEAIKFSKRYMKFKKEQDMNARRIRGY